ncbi:hypothetical protein EXIGLDRAFT_290620 [Exidia glandulosa HHB12029]|uniref:Uncharacterized protein n=1 Tax=Exidia glandulosa HHB12029 TaxID=1314781 RepID=A0A165DEX8_EXIGL|nr:hypothetical protein EXIGLDRAFT_290620 [Exidia glandulosa HHB12029]
MVLGQPRAGQHISLEVLFFLYCGGDDEDVVVFVSPVYAVCVGESTSRAVVVPKASAALSGLLRCADQSELMRTGTFGLQDLLNEMVDPEDVRRLLKLY